MIQLNFEKLYRYPRIGEPCSVAIPCRKGEVLGTDLVSVRQKGSCQPVQAKVTSRYDDGSIRWMYLRFSADLPANDSEILECRLDDTGEGVAQAAQTRIHCSQEAGITELDCGLLRFSVKDYSSHLFHSLWDGRKRYDAVQWEGPYLLDEERNKYELHLNTWKVAECGAVCAVVKADGSCSSGTKQYACSVKITAYYGKPWMELSFTLVNSTDEVLQIGALKFALKACPDRKSGSIIPEAEQVRFRTQGIQELPQIEQQIAPEQIRTCVAVSNYKTRFEIAGGGTRLEKTIDAQHICAEASEHFPEVFYGTFFADRTDAEGGVCAAVYQAYQNYPKAVEADADGICVSLVPEGVGKVVMQPGMAREQRMQLHFHAADETLTELNHRSIVYQMPDRPVLHPSVYAEAAVMPDIFMDAEHMDAETEIMLTARADEHARAFGMMNWGDTPDPGYTSQGRGHGAPVWTNNEYDFTHACALLYARSGLRRFLDYALVSGSHWKDVDVCHYSSDPLKMGGHWEHTHGHNLEGRMLCSHEWVEGLLDCWHFTGDESYLETALGIGENVLRLLDTPAYQVSGEMNARETGWALRTLTALYIETNERRWTEKAEWIIGQFKEWNEKYGHWLAPYLDNVLIRVPFMISVAVGSLMRYYQTDPREDLKQMMLDAIDDMVQNCLFENGFFYYKELPSLNRLGNNSLILEALTIGYRLSGDRKYLEYGKRTFAHHLQSSSDYTRFDKCIYEDAVLMGKNGSKNFAQSFLPLALYSKALSEQK